MFNKAKTPKLRRPLNCPPSPNDIIVEKNIQRVFFILKTAKLCPTYKNIPFPFALIEVLFIPPRGFPKKKDF